jgi:biopolymer transport protein TolQ
VGNRSAAEYACTVDDSDIANEIVFTRTSASSGDAATVHWEIVEYVGANGGDNEFIVRGRGITTYGVSANTATTSAISGVVSDAKMLPWVTGLGGGFNTIYDGNTRLTWNAGDDTIALTRDRQTGSIAASVSWAAVEWTGSNWSAQVVARTVAVGDAGTTIALGISDVGSTSRAFLHVQYAGPQSQRLASQSLRVWLSASDTVSILVPTEFTGTLQVRAWVLSNAQTGTGAMDVQRYTASNTGDGEFDPQRQLEQLGRWVAAQRALDAALVGVAGGEELVAIARQHPEAPGAPVLLALCAREGEHDVLTAVAARAMVEVHHRLSTFMPTLASIGSASPFVGLFGTVYGILDAFLRIGREKSATLPVVAPAIGEALIATAVGLFAAIPAVIAYNALSKRLDDLHAQLDAASSEWVILVGRPQMVLDAGAEGR